MRASSIGFRICSRLFEEGLDSLFRWLMERSTHGFYVKSFELMEKIIDFSVVGKYGMIYKYFGYGKKVEKKDF